MRVAGLILAGGQGQRMGGVDKGLQLLHEKPLVQHVIERMQAQVDGLWLCTNRHFEHYQTLGLSIFSDETTWQGMGPLAGIASFAPHLPPEFTHVQIMPCDTPFLPIDLCAQLKQGIRTICAFRSFTGGVYPHTEYGAQYGCALVTRSQLALAQSSLNQHEKSLHAWLARAHAVPMKYFIESDFMNINTAEQLTAAQHRIDLDHLSEPNHA